MQDQSYYINSFYVRLLGSIDNGSKSKVIFLHGLLGNGQNWASIAKKLAENFEILLIDQRGHGKTKPVSGGFTPEDFSRDLDLITKELGWNKFSIVGHSLGARVAMCYASKFPEKIEKIIFEDMGPHKTGATSIKTAQMINSVPSPFENRAKAKDFFKNKFEPIYGHILSNYLYSNLKVTSSTGAMEWRFNKEGVMSYIKGSDRELWNEFMSIQAPNLIIRGSKSEHLTKKVFKEMLKKNAFSKGVEISGAGHWVHFDQMANFVKEVDTFLLE